MTRHLPFAAALLAAALIPGSTYAQDQSDIRTAIRSGLVGEARYEILTLPKTSETYRLDRISGEVSRLQRSGTRFTAMTLAWKSLPTPPQADEGAQAARVNFQMVLSETGSFPMLMNVHTGATWVLRTAAGEVKWEPIAIER